MRLTDEILRASDDAELTLIGKALALGAAGQFGLFPGQRPFQISLNIGKESLHVEMLDCLALTRAGNLIDVVYNAKYDNTFDTSISLLKYMDASELYLTISILEGQWKETPGGYEEPVYEFGLITPNNPIAGNAFPIAHLVNSEYGGWHVDDIDFLPPCLFLSSHPKYEELFGKFQETLSIMNKKAFELIHSDAKGAMRTFLPILQQIMITTDKERDLMTPMKLLGLIQRYICAFTTSCELDENVGLSDASAYYNLAYAPYSPQKVYPMIRETLEVCFEIRDKVDKIQIMAPAPAPVPTPKTVTPHISENQLVQNCRSKTVSITVTHPGGNATVFYSTDGSEPSKKLAGNSQIVFENGFNKHRTPEPDKNVVIKLKAIANGVSSEVVSYTITLHKDYRTWDGYEI